MIVSYTNDIPRRYPDSSGNCMQFDLNPIVEPNFGCVIDISNDIRTYTFNSSTNLKVYWPIDVSILLVGGGSGTILCDKDHCSGGGGGGAVKEYYNYHISPGYYNIVVGTGAKVGVAGSIKGGNSQLIKNNSILLDASGGTGTGYIPGDTPVGITSGNGHNGGVGYDDPVITGRSRSGGGGGDSENGTNGTLEHIGIGYYGKGGNGGKGTLSKITGEYYGGGGGGIAITFDGIDGSGVIGGGGHGSGLGRGGQGGHTGVIIIRYKEPVT